MTTPISVKHVASSLYKMVKKKRQSKRTPAAKRYKIEKKVREHKRKIKKEAKLKTKTKRARLRKDPGIPNLFPFKEQVLKEIEAKKEKERENRERHQKEQRQKEITKRRSLQSFQNDINKRTKQFEKKEASRESTDGFKMPKSESSLKAFYKEFRKVVDGSDVILEVLDARDPLGCRCIEMEQTVLASGSNKKLILILNKIDLIPRDNVTKWLKYLRNEFPTIAFKASTQSQKSNLSCKTFQLSNTKSFERSSVCLGSDMLMKLLGNYCRSLDIKTSITVGVVGIVLNNENIWWYDYTSVSMRI
jgi:nuclear GTP-binding protein